MKCNVQEQEGRIRPDGTEKVTGALKYLTDLSFPEHAIRKSTSKPISTCENTID